MRPKCVEAIRTPEGLWHVFGDTYHHKQEVWYKGCLQDVIAFIDTLKNKNWPEIHA